MKLKTLLFSFLLVFSFLQLSIAQVLEPVKWNHKANQLSETEWELTFTASIEDGWYLYSQDEPDGLGPLPTYFEYQDQEKGYELIGSTSEPNIAPKFDKVFEIDIKKFQKQAVFKQKIKVTDTSLNQFQVLVDYMSCDDEKCIPADYSFLIQLGGSAAAVKAPNVELDDRSKTLSEALNIGVTGWDQFEEETINEKSNLSIFFLGFLGGLIALLTPCVFPMIPLTVSFFTKSGQNKKKGTFNSVLYGFFIFLIYVLLSLPFHLLDTLDPEILNNISTNVTLNIIFFVIFLVFAFSFFGYFELTLPASWSNALDSKANSIGGIIGIFFMAITLAIVSFSCTGPILGTLLGSSLSSDGGATQLTLGMSGFGLALALPFSLFAMFPNWLHSLPKSGGWLNTVKVVLGFIELALALKFLSNADLVEHWGLLKREVFIGLWILIGIGLVLYLLGKIKFPHDGPLTKISKGRWVTAILTLVFVIYLIPGLTNSAHANLKALSGFPPPMFYSIYDQESDCPLGLNCYKDFGEGLAAAKAENKPIMLDFTGWACVNCRKMEEQVWSTSDVYDILNEEFVIISLYVDDRSEMSEENQFNYLRPNETLKTIKTIGDKWGTFQTINFQNNSQPYYVLLNHDMELLNTTTAYTPDADEYNEWLEKGLENFSKAF
ncbi:MAG: cytochrome c biogenesis protein CcdA [Bacteroidota bacterium]